MVATATHVASNSASASPLSLAGSTSGDLLLIFTKDGAGTAEIATSVTDTAGGSWTRLSFAPTTGTVGRRVELWTKFGSAAITAVSVAFTGTTAAHASLIKLNNVSTTFGQGPYATSFQAATTTPTELTVALPEPNMLVISALQANSNTQAQHVQETGWTKGTTSTAGPAWAWRNDLGAVTDGCKWTTTASQGVGSAIIAFRSAPATSPTNMFGAEVPGSTNSDGGAGTPYTLGTKFTALVAGKVWGARWRIPLTPQPVGSGTGEGLTFVLYTAAGVELTRTAVSSIGKEGTWTEFPFPADVALTANTDYVIAVYEQRYYVATVPYTSWGTNNADNTLRRNAGCFDGTWAPTFPTTEFGDSNYFPDVVFVPDVVAPSGPTIKVWNGTAEVSATITIWNGTAEVPASVSSIV